MYEGMHDDVLVFERTGTELLRGTVTPGDALGTAFGRERTRTA
jgi:hypothetical protein